MKLLLSITITCFLLGCKDNSKTSAESLTISPSGPLDLLLGDSLKFSNFYIGTDGSAKTVVVKWSSTNSGVATATADGVVIANAIGASTIMAAYGTVFSKGTNVNVIKNVNKVAKAEISVAKTSIKLGQTITFSSLALNSDGIEIPGKKAVWASDDADIVLIDGNGLATATGPGTTFITAKIDNVKSNKVDMTVTP